MPRSNDRRTEPTLSRRRTLLLLAAASAAGIAACAPPVPKTGPATATTAAGPAGGISPLASAPTAAGSADAPSATPTPGASAITPATSPAPTATNLPTVTPAATATPTAAPATAAPPTVTPTAIAPTATTVPTATVAGPATTTRTLVSRAGDLAGFTLVSAVREGAGIVLAPSGAGRASSGEVLSPIHEADFPFDAVILSWNADAPASTGLRFEARVRTSGSWSAWYALGTWRTSGGASVAGQSDALGRVDVDTLKLKSPAAALQYRALLQGDGAATPTLRLLAANYAIASRAPAGPAIDGSAAKGRDLDVPRLSQLDQDPSIATQICSPTSLTMALRYWKVDQAVIDTVRGVRDAATGIYGNWPLNAAYAATRGLESWIDRFYSVDQLAVEIAAGRPVVVSYLSNTTGHLIVVRGFTAGGDVVVNDPIFRGAAIRQVIGRAQFAKVWLGEGGVVYRLQPRG